MVGSRFTNFKKHARMAERSKAPRSGRGLLCRRGFESHFLHYIFATYELLCKNAIVWRARLSFSDGPLGRLLLLYIKLWERLVCVICVAWSPCYSPQKSLLFASNYTASKNYYHGLWLLRSVIYANRIHLSVLPPSQCNQPMRKRTTRTVVVP